MKKQTAPQAPTIIDPQVLKQMPSAIHEDQLWVSRFMDQCRDLPERLRRALIPVAYNARSTTFVADCDYVQDGMQLSTLARYTREPESRFNLIVGLKRLELYTIGSALLHQYFQEFSEQTGLTELVTRRVAA